MSTNVTMPTTDGPPPPAPPPVSRLGRVLDLLALLLVVIGAGWYLVSYLGLERLRTAPAVEFYQGMPIEKLAEHHRLVVMSRWALAAIIVGVACGVFAWFRERRAAA